MNKHISKDLYNKALGAYLGLAAGDALGATVEFMTPFEIKCTHGIHRKITGGGWLRLKPGEVTDDTEMALALGDAILASGGWDISCVADSFANWMRGCPKDIGSTVRRGIQRYLLKGKIHADETYDHAGNGAVMRHLPAVLSNLDSGAIMLQRCLDQAWITHRHPLADEALVTTAGMTQCLICGGNREDALRQVDSLIQRYPKFRWNPWPGQSTGYIVDTMQTVFDAYFSADNFEEALIRAVNRGGDADTIGAITGQLAGATWGADAIPKKWIRRLDSRVVERIKIQVASLLSISHKSPRIAALKCTLRRPLLTAVT